MPLLKRKRVPPVACPAYDADKKESRNSTVWYSPLTKEIFQDYSYPFYYLILFFFIVKRVVDVKFFFKKKNYARFISIFPLTTLQQ